MRDYASGSQGFNHGEAEESVHRNGFYLFQLINTSDFKLWVDRAARSNATVRLPFAARDGNGWALGSECLQVDRLQPGAGRGWTKEQLVL